MSVHQSPRRHSGRFQDTYEDGTDEDEQHLLQPADRYVRQERALGCRRPSPQDQHPRHTQLHASYRNFADHHHAAAVGPFPNAPLPANSAGEGIAGPVDADPANSAGQAPLPPSQHRSLPSAPHHHRGLSPLDLALQPAYEEAAVRGGRASFTAATTSHASHLAKQHHTQRTESDANREKKSAFDHAAAPYKSMPFAVPPLDLPTFDGDIRKYLQFRDAFDKAIGNSDMTPQYKLQYLLMHLRGEPLNFAEQFVITDENYDRVIAGLDSQYDDKYRLCAVLHQNLFDIRPPSEEPRDLRRFHREVQTIQSLFHYIGETLNGNTFVEPLLARKLPKTIRLDLVRSYGYVTDSYNTSALLDCLNKYCRDAEWSDRADRFLEGPSDWGPSLKDIAVDTSDLNSQGHLEELKTADVESSETANSAAFAAEYVRRANVESSETANSAAPAAGYVPRVAAAVPNTIADEQLQERRTCPLCGDLHSAADCTTYDTAKKRTRRALKLKLCLLCLRAGHPAVSCPRRTTQPCKVCGHGQHSRALCLAATGEKQRRTRHPSPVRATRGPNRDPEASDQQRQSRPSARATTNLRIAKPSVIRDATTLMATATTMRPSGTQSSRATLDGNLINRKKQSKDLGTDPPGRAGTNRPPTTSTDESMMQNEADAYGSDRLLPGRDLLLTDKCSTNREMMQFNRTHGDGSDKVPPGGIPDENDSRELSNDEDASHQPSDGHRTDAVPGHWSSDVPDETRFPPYEESTAYVACAFVSDEQPAVLHECLAVTAMNPASKKSRRAVLMFDSGSTYSHVSSELAHFLDLPQHEMRVQNVSTFGSWTPLSICGFRTFLVLRSEHRRSLQINVTALDCIVPSVRTALIRDADLPALRRSDCTPTTTREMPDLLVGQDLVHLFDRELEPTLPSGYYIVGTCFGPAIGGARRSVPRPLKASTTPHAAPSAAEDGDIALDDSLWWTSTSPPSPIKATGRHHLRPLQLPACPPANSAGDIAVAAHGTTECLEPSTTTSFSSEQSSLLLRASGTLPRSPQKQLFTKPLDTQLLLLPTYSSTCVKVEGVSTANSAAELPRLTVDEAATANSAAVLPRPLQEPLRSTDADDQHRSTLPLPTHGDLIFVSFYDAGSPLQRKTRLRPQLPPPCAWQCLGIYATPEPVLAVMLLLPACSTPVGFQRAERNPPLVLMSSTSFTMPQTVILLSSLFQRLCALQLHAVLVPDVRIADLCSGHRRPASTSMSRTIEWTWSCNEFLRWLRSVRYLLTHARAVDDRTPLGSAHRPLTAQDATTATKRSSQQPTPQPPAHQPASPPTACLPPLLPRCTLGRVLIDCTRRTLPRQSHAKDSSRPERPTAPAAPWTTLRISQQLRVAVPRLPAVFKQFYRRPTSSNLATNHSILDRHAMKYASITSHMATTEKLTAESRTPDNLTDHDRDEAKDTRQGVPGPANSAGLVASTTCSGAITTGPGVSPANSAGTTGTARQDSETSPEDRSSKSSTSSNTDLSTIHRKKEKTPDALQFTEGFLPDHHEVEVAAQRALTDQPPQPPANSAGAAGVNSSETANSAASAVGNAGEAVRVQFEPPSHIRCAASVQSKPPNALTLPPELADEQLTPSEIAFWEDFDIRGARLLLNESTYARTDANFRKEIDVSWDHWCTYHPKAPTPWTKEWTRHKLGKFLFARYQRQWPEVVYREIADNQDETSALTFYKAAMNHLRTIITTDVLTDDQATLAFDALRSSLPPGGPRADLVDQILRAPRHCMDGVDADLADQQLPAPPAHRQATRVTQEPLEPLAGASPQRCAFCGRLHLSYECDVYVSVTQRLRRARQLEHCFICLGRDHQSRSCPMSTASMCTTCRRGQHHKAFCHDAAPRVPKAHSATVLGAPATSPAASSPLQPTLLGVSSSTPVVSHAKGRRTCAFCQCSHSTARCTAYASISQRLTRVRQLKLCFVCLRDGHHATSCPSGARTCRLCSNGSHHQALCRRSTTTKPTDNRVNGIHHVKKRVNTARVRVNNRDACPLKNETICFCDVSTFHQFGRQLRSEVRMIETPMSTPTDTINFVCSFRPAGEVTRVIFWFSSYRASLNHVELVRLVTELSQYYTTHYEAITQYIVVTPSVSSRQDVWTYGLFKYLVQAQVLLPDARLTLLPHDIPMQDANEHHANDAEVLSPYAIEDVKHYLRKQHQIDLWTHYIEDHRPRTASATPVKVVPNSAASATAPLLSHTKATANSAAAEVHAPSPTPTTIADLNTSVEDVAAAAGSGSNVAPPVKLSATTSSSTDAHAIATSAANTHRPPGPDHRRRYRDQGPAPQAHGLDYRTVLPPRSPNKDRERNQ